MDDPELERIRQQRLAQLQAQHGVCFCYFRLYTKNIWLPRSCCS